MNSMPQTILAIDIGNTAMKLSVFEDGRLIQSAAGHPGSAEDVVEAVGTMLTFNSADGLVWCSVGKDFPGVPEMLHAEHSLRVVELTPATPLPIDVSYGTRDTLGADRLAAAVGVADPARPVLVVDAGTAVTSDIVADGRFEGGNISPGLALRFKMLASHTSRLPLVEAAGELPAFGHDTETAIRAGVVGGLVAELADNYRKASALYPEPRMILTGGDAPFLAPLLRAGGIEVDLEPEAVGLGLVRIFNYNYKL